MTEKKVRAHAIISGKVQGVFFRMETQKAVREIGDICGWVRNKSDGTVEAVFEGDENRVIRALEWCKKGSPRASVRRVDVTWGDCTNASEGFDITW
ncbi:acylphosphatase [Desulfonema ishimotonii]|uniref:Acylphosphatase n=1 Tax=Desulfonema ishimotonii TaxID=45657 RepID=A0A401G4I4_9BACT|nr:acylphosphatase [Desulfonema ishimotonii]GBC64124.1 acylphosphatase [Desulfonema ishimotonii]